MLQLPAVFSTVTHCTGLQPRSNRLSHIAEVCSWLSHLGWCEFTLWCSQMTKWPKNVFVRAYSHHYVAHDYTQNTHMHLSQMSASYLNLRHALWAKPVHTWCYNFHLISTTFPNFTATHKLKPFRHLVPPTNGSFFLQGKVPHLLYYLCISKPYVTCKTMLLLLLSLFFFQYCVPNNIFPISPGICKVQFCIAWWFGGTHMLHYGTSVFHIAAPKNPMCQSNWLEFLKKWWVSWVIHLQPLFSVSCFPSLSLLLLSGITHSPAHLHLLHPIRSYECGVSLCFPGNPGSGWALHTQGTANAKP